MFKDVFVLKKTSWHVKMMKYIWNLDYKSFSHMCPYWWLSVFNVLVAFIPFFLVKEGYWLCSIVFPWLGKKLEQFFSFVFKWLGKLFTWIGLVLVAFYQAVLLPIGNWLGRKCSRAEKAISTYLSRVREERRLAARERFLANQQREEEELKTFVDSLRGDDLIAYIEKTKGRIDEKVKTYIQYNDSSFFNQVMDGVASFNYRQQEIGRENAAKARARELERQAQRESAWGRSVGEEPINPVRKIAVVKPPKPVKITTEEELRLKEEREKQRIIANKARIVKLVNFIRPIMKALAYLIGAAAACLLLYGLYLAAPIIWGCIVIVAKVIWAVIMFIIHIPGYIWDFFCYIGRGFANIKHSTWVSIGGAIWFAIKCLLGLGAVFLFIVLCAWISEHYGERIGAAWDKRPRVHINVRLPKRNKRTGPSVREHVLYGIDKFTDFWAIHVGDPWIWGIEKVFRSIGMFFIATGKFFVILGHYLVDFCKWCKGAVLFLIQMIKNQCPAIKWED